MPYPVPAVGEQLLLDIMRMIELARKREDDYARGVSDALRWVLGAPPPNVDPHEQSE